MGKQIKKLSAELINKIAAGEVVERPSSVVKELIENSIDAGATHIAVEIHNGGISKISIQDDGSGMTPEDALLSLERHTTSKIESFDDLYSLDTHGFRGEALSSIASVSKLLIETKRHEAPVGVRLTNVSGEVVASTFATLDGTKIIIEDLFYNVPARKKFLKSDSTEYNHIIELFNQYAIFHYQIGWKLIHNDHQVLNVAPTSNRLERIKEVLGLDVARELVEIKVPGTISLEGYVGKPSIFRSNKKGQFLYVNNRPVQDYVISKAVSEAYESMAVKGSYPTFILALNLPGTLVDINVHPRKTEVRFQQPNEVYRTVLTAVRAILRNEKVLTTAPISFSSRGNQDYEPIDSSGFIFQHSPRPENLPLTPPSQPASDNFKSKLTFTAASDIVRSPSYVRAIQEPELNSSVLNSLKLVGQIHNSYIVAESINGLVIIDQHAAAERLNFERFMAEYHAYDKKSQALLVPLVLELGHREGELISSAAEFLEGCGFDLEHLGSGAVAVNSVPHGFDRLDIQELIHGVVADLEADEFDHLHSAEEMRQSVIRSASCRGAIMFNDALTFPEMQQLIDDIGKLPQDKLTCCHGRPFMKEFLKTDFERLFHRR